MSISTTGSSFTTANVLATLSLYSCSSTPVTVRDIDSSLISSSSSNVYTGCFLTSLCADGLLDFAEGSAFEDVLDPELTAVSSLTSQSSFHTSSFLIWRCPGGDLDVADSSAFADLLDADFTITATQIIALIILIVLVNWPYNCSSCV